MGSVWTWLGLGAREPQESSALRDVVNALDRLEPDRARYVARFAYLLGRVAHADQHASAEETSVMERLVRDEGGLTLEQAMLVVSLAKTSNLLFGGTADFEVARDFAAGASYEVLVDDVPLKGDATADSSGSFTTTITAPSEPGYHSVSVRMTKDATVIDASMVLVKY